MKPKNLLIYYGWLNSFNSAQNSWDNEKVAQEFARYNMLAWGDGVQNPNHGDYANTSIIISRIKVLNPSTRIFGYVAVNQSFADFKTKVDQWNSLGIYGILMDCAGYDWGTVATNGREALNSKVNYVHGLNSARSCFLNSWNPDHIMGTTNDVSYPNSTWNPNLMQSNVSEYDWYLLESHAITAASAYESMTQWYDRGNVAKGKKRSVGIQLAAASIISDDDAGGQAKFNFIYTAACLWSLDAVGSSDTSYGATNAKSKLWNRPDVSDIGEIYSETPIVKNSGNAYFRYFDSGVLRVDFTSSSETSSVTKY